MSDNENNGVTDNTPIAAALQTLAAVVATLRPPVTPIKVRDLFVTNYLFVLDTCSGSSTYSTVSYPLDEIGDGEANTVPSFLVALHVYSKQGK